jgi:hypothetical protein
MCQEINGKIVQFFTYTFDLFLKVQVLYGLSLLVCLQYGLHSGRDLIRSTVLTFHSPNCISLNSITIDNFCS